MADNNSGNAGGYGSGNGSSSWWSTAATAAALYVAAVLASYLWSRFVRPRSLALQGKHVFITGGTKGLGRSLALLMAQRGAHVTVTARTEADLAALKPELEKASKDAAQHIVCLPCDVTQNDQVVRTLERAKEISGVPHYVIPCAGAAYPGIFLDNPVKVCEDTMQLNYFGTLYTVHKAANMMREGKVKGHIVIVASTLAVTTFGGYSSYSPTKFALKGLADTLLNEFTMYGIKVQIFYPANMDTPGFQIENKTKPAFTKEIEGLSETFKPDYCASTLLKEMESGHYHLYLDEITNVFRIFANGATPQRNIAYEWLIRSVLTFAQPIVSFWANSVVKKHAKNLKTAKTD